jgi:hypothetical protein
MNDITFIVRCVKKQVVLISRLADLLQVKASIPEVLKPNNLKYKRFSQSMATYRPV